MKQIPSFKCLTMDFNSSKVEYYDVMPHFIESFNNKRKSRSKEFDVFLDKPTTRDQVKQFVSVVGHSRFWSRCEYEVIVSGWPGRYDKERYVSWVMSLDKNNIPNIPDFRQDSVKIDVWDQIDANLDLVVDLLCNYFNIK